MILIQSYTSNVFWAIFTGVVFAKLSRPSRLKRTIQFSEVAVINCQTPSFEPEDPRIFEFSFFVLFYFIFLFFYFCFFLLFFFFFLRLCPYICDYGFCFQLLLSLVFYCCLIFLKKTNSQTSNTEIIKKKFFFFCFDRIGEYKVGYPVLQFRFVDVRPRSRICDPSFHLICFRRVTKEDGYEDCQMTELDFEINLQRGRIRTMETTSPFLSIPWTLCHRIDKHSPLFGMTKQQMIDQKVKLK